MKYSSLITIFFFLFFSLLIMSCEVDNNPEVYQEGSNKYTNDWIYKQMKKYYKWNETMPDKGDLSLNSKEYFSKLLQKDDIYSYALHPELPETAPQSIRSKYGFDLSFIEFQGKFYGVILYVLYDSPAKNNGLSRGQLITKINGSELNLANYNNLYKSIIASSNLDLEIISYSAQSGFSDSKEISLLQGYTFGQPINYKVIQEKNTRVGYIEIAHFDVGQAQLFLQILQELKSKSITELILDLRYNGGGDISSATALSIIVAPNIESNNLFIKFEANANGGNVDQSFLQALQSNESKVSFDALRSAHPFINRIYVLCGNRTASASELIINNLKPYMDVITIGEKTFGKDVAGFPIEDDRISGKRGWVLYLSIYKLFNARHQGDYSKGINPVLAANELQEPEVFPLGSTSEVLLSKALNAISGNTSKIKTATLRSLPLSTIYTDVDPLLPFTP
jgi:carboxyl-terminal processing protease